MATVPAWRPCLACASRQSTNRPLSFHLRKGVRKHLAFGVCFRAEKGAQAVLPPLAEIPHTACLCLACVKVIDGILAGLDKMPVRINSPAGAAATARPTRTIARARPAAAGAALARVARQVVATRGKHEVSLLPKPAAGVPTEPQPATPPAPPPVIEVEIPSRMLNIPAGRCIVCYLSSNAAATNGTGIQPNGAAPVYTMRTLREAVTNQVGTHLMTIESVVRIFRAARVELAEGVCDFNSRAFAALLLRPSAAGVALCAAHQAALAQAAEVKAAGAVPCAICGQKPTLDGGEEVRSLAPVLAGGREEEAIWKVVIDIRRRWGKPVAEFEKCVRRFLEKEFSCALCFSLLDRTA